MLTVILQPTVKLIALSRSERDRLRDVGDAVPDVLDELNTLRNSEIEHICDGNLAHLRIVAQSTNADKIAAHASNI